MANHLRRTLLGAATALGFVAMVGASVTPAAAQWRGHRGFGGGAVAAGVIGGLALGAIAAGAANAYPEPVYVAPEPVYGPVCHVEWRPVYAFDGAYVRDRRVTVCD